MKFNWLIFFLVIPYPLWSQNPVPIQKQPVATQKVNVSRKIDSNIKHILNEAYSKDSLYVYLFEDTLSHINPKHFRLLDTSSETFSFARDDKNVYRFGEKIECDISSFEALTEAMTFSYSRDKFNGFYNCKKIPGSHGLSFSYIGSVCAKDKNRVYLQDSPIPEADPSSFKILKGDYALDHKNVYYIFFDNFEESFDMSYKILKGANPNTFTSLGCRYGKDARSVYYTYKKIIDVDLASFNIDPRDCEHVFYAIDKKRQYENGVPMP